MIVTLLCDYPKITELYILKSEYYGMWTISLNKAVIKENKLE